MGNVLALLLETVEREKVAATSLSAAGTAKISAQDLAGAREVKAMIAVIDKEMGNYKNLAELDFRAGYVAGRIYEKEAAGCITPRHRQELINILYAKYETIRGLEMRDAGCCL